MTVTLQQVEQLAELALLALDDEEKLRLALELSTLLDHLARLNELDTDDIPPTAAVLPLRNALRVDEPRPPTPTADILSNAPAAQDGCFVVPGVQTAEQTL